MYVSGLNPTIQNIYQKVEFPIGSGTPSIQSLPFWDHTNHFTPLVSLHRLVSHIQLLNIQNVFNVENFCIIYIQLKFLILTHYKYIYI